MFHDLIGQITKQQVYVWDVQFLRLDTVDMKASLLLEKIEQDLPRKEWITLNHLRTGVGRIGATGTSGVLQTVPTANVEIHHRLGNTC